MPQMCRVRRGFFVLRDCGEPATVQCPSCSRGVCKAHFVQESRLCSECHGRRKTVDDWRDDEWVYARRDRYYREYEPIYWGSFHHDPYYDSYNVRDFDGAGAAAYAYDGDEAGGFHDS